MESGHKGLTVEELEILKHLLPCERSEARWKNHFYMLDRIFYSLRRAFRDAIGQGSVVPLRPTSSATLVGTKTESGLQSQCHFNERTKILEKRSSACVISYGHG